MCVYKITIQSFKEKWSQWFLQPMLKCLFRVGLSRGKAQIMPAREWLPTRQWVSQLQQRIEKPPVAQPPTGWLPPLGQTGPRTPLPQTFSAGQHQPGDIFRAYISRPEHYHPRYPQASERPAHMRITALVPQETPAWLTEEKAGDRASIFAVTEEEMQPDIRLANDDETAREPALYKMRLFLRDHQT